MQASGLVIVRAAISCRASLEKTEACNSQHLIAYLVKAIQTVLIDLDRPARMGPTPRLTGENRLRLCQLHASVLQKTPEHEIAALTITSPEA